MKRRCRTGWATCLFGLLAVVGTATAGNWEARPDLGGWLDKDTGLVWGEDVNTFKFRTDPTWPGLTITWSGAVNFVTIYRAATGFNDWRLPTTAEGSVAVGHGITPILFPMQLDSVDQVWTSETKGSQQAYTFSLWTGRAVLHGKESTFYPGAILVRSTLPPPPPRPGKKLATTELIPYFP